jgi:hypothetical protein
VNDASQNKTAKKSSVRETRGSKIFRWMRRMGVVRGRMKMMVRPDIIIVGIKGG